MGKSPYHSTGTALVLNLDTNTVTVQQHVIYDDFLDTVEPNADLPKLWPTLLRRNYVSFSADSGSRGEAGVKIRPGRLVNPVTRLVPGLPVDNASCLEL